MATTNFELSNMRNDKPNLIVDSTFKLALDIISLSKILQGLKQYSLADQVFRSGISIGANVREAQNAESKVDFIHKLKIAAKEADELEYYLLLMEKSEHLPSQPMLLDEVKSVIKILSKIISTSKSKTQFSN